MNIMRFGAVPVLAIFVSVLAGCQQEQQQQRHQAVDLKCQYQVGNVEKIHYSSVRTYKNWIELEDKKPQGMSSRKNTENLILKREIQSVEADGSAVMKVTIEQADVELDLDMPEVEKTKHYYHSGPAGTDGTWAAMPALAGVEYTLKIAPNTQVLEIQGLEGVREKYYSGDKETLVSDLISEEGIRRIHQRDFVRSAPGPLKAGQTYELAVEIPDVMVKAEAVKRIFTVDSIKAGTGGTAVSIRSTSEPLMVRPEGIPRPPRPQDFGALLKDASDMQEFKYDGNDTFDASRGCVLKEELKMYCNLMMLEETFFAGMEKYGKDPHDKTPNTNAMLTEVTFESTCENVE